MDEYLLACGMLLMAGLMLNILSPRMFLLTAVVGAGYFIPAPRETAEQFYGFCIGMELCVAVLALLVDRDKGVWIAELAALLVFAHVMGYLLDGSPPYSPYRIIVKLLEAAQLLVCVILSPVIMPILRNRDAPTS